MNQLVDLDVVPGADRHADAGMDARVRVVGQQGRLGQSLLDLADHLRHILRMADPVQDDRELVATQTGDGIHFAHAGQQARRRQFQHLVTSSMTERVIDRLEAVNIDEQQ
jgi:hypothetical protein